MVFLDEPERTAAVRQFSTLLLGIVTITTWATATSSQLRFRSDLRDHPHANGVVLISLLSGADSSISEARKSRWVRVCRN
jgi:hypothetical protein